MVDGKQGWVGQEDPLLSGAGEFEGVRRGWIALNLPVIWGSFCFVTLLF